MFIIFFSLIVLYFLCLDIIVITLKSKHMDWLKSNKMESINIWKYGYGNIFSGARFFKFLYSKDNLNDKKIMIVKVFLWFLTVVFIAMPWVIKFSGKI